jgi:hypothetical protein
LTPETTLFLEKSHEPLERADTMMGVGLTVDAGRAACLAELARSYDVSKSTISRLTM